MSLRAATHSRLCAKSSTPGESRGVADCHFAVRLNHLIPGSRSYAVAVILKWQSGITLGGGPSTRPSTTRCAGGTSRRKNIGVPHAAPLLGMNRGLARRSSRCVRVCSRRCCTEAVSRAKASPVSNARRKAPPRRSTLGLIDPPPPSPD